MNISDILNKLEKVINDNFENIIIKKHKDKSGFYLIMQPFRTIEIYFEQNNL